MNNVSCISVEYNVELMFFQGSEAWHSSDSEDSSADDAASSAGNSGSISQPSTPAPSLPEDAFIPGVRSLRRRLVISDNSAYSSKSRKRPQTENPESTSAKLAKTTEDLARSVGQLVTTAPATSSASRASSKQRPLRPAVSAPPTQRAVLRIAQPDGTVCFLAIDNVSDISRLPVTAVVQQLMASQKQASANHRLSLAGSVPRSAGAPVIPRSAGLVPGFVGSRVTASAGASAPLLPLAAKTSVTSMPSQSVISTSLGLSPPPKSVGVLPSLPVQSQLAQLPVLRPQKPSLTNSLSAAMNRLRSQNALAQLFQNRALNLRGLNATQSVNSQQLLNNIMAIRAAALSSATPAASSAASRVLPVAADQSVSFAVPVAVTMPSKLPSLSTTTLNPRPAASTQLPNTVISSSSNQKPLLDASLQEVKEVSGLAVPIVTSCPGRQVNCTPVVSLSANHVAGVPSVTVNAAAALTSVAQRVILRNPSTSGSDIVHIPAIRSLATIRPSVTESSLSMAVRAAVAAGRGPNLLCPLTRPQQSRYVSGLTVKTLLENRSASLAESMTPSSAEMVSCSTSGAIGHVVSSAELSGSVIKPQALTPDARLGLGVQTSVQCAVSSTQQLTGRPALAFLPPGVNIATPARIHQLVAVTTIAKPTLSVSQLSLTSQAITRSFLVSRTVDTGTLRPIIPNPKSRASPSRPSRNNTRTTSVMKAPIPALPRLTDLGLGASSSADHISVSGSTISMAPVSLLASPSATVSQHISTISVPRTLTTVSSTGQPAVALVGGGNKPVIVAAGASSLVVPQNNTPGQVFLLQSAGSGLVQLVQVAAVSQSVHSHASVPTQQVILTQRPAVAGSNLHFYSASSAPLVTSSTVSPSVPVVQFVIRPSSSTTSPSLTRTNSASSTTSGVPVALSVGIVSQAASVVSSPQLISSPNHLPVTKQPPVSNTIDHARPAGISPRHSTELSKSSCLAEAADLFLMAASVVDRTAVSAADEDAGRSSAGAVMSPSTSFSM